MEKRTHAGYKACLEDEAYSSGDELGIVGDGLLFKVEGRTSSGRMTPPVVWDLVRGGQSNKLIILGWCPPPHLAR